MRNLTIEGDSWLGNVTQTSSTKDYVFRTYGTYANKDIEFTVLLEAFDGAFDSTVEYSFDEVIVAYNKIIAKSNAINFEPNFANELGDKCAGSFVNVATTIDNLNDLIALCSD